MTASHSLALFPLHRTVLPGSALTIRAYEAWERSLIDEIGGAHFGVVLRRAEEGTFHDVGTEVRIVSRRVLDDGRVLIDAVGERRFAISEQRQGDPYPVADVVYPTESGKDLEGIRAEVVRSLRRYLAATAESGERADVLMEMPSDPVAASYRVASAMRLSSPERQELLELPVADRLARELMLLRRETDLLERTMGIERT